VLLLMMLLSPVMQLVLLQQVREEV